MKALDLTKRINRARRRGLDTTVLERELAQADAESKQRREESRIKKLAAERARHSRAVQMPEQAKLRRIENLRGLMIEAESNGYSLGWVMQEHVRRYARLPGNDIWPPVAREFRDRIVEAQVSKAVMKVRVMQS